MPPRGTRRGSTSASEQQSSSSPLLDKQKNPRLVAIDHDDEVDDTLMARNPRDFPYPSFDPVGDTAKKLVDRDLKQAKKQYRLIRHAPAVRVIAAPAEPDRAPWRSCIVQHKDDAPPLDLRTNKDGTTGDYYKRQEQQGIVPGLSPNGYLLQQERPKWVAIAHTQLATGCPSKGIPVQIPEDPSAVSMRLFASHKKKHDGSSSSRSSSIRSARQRSMSSTTGWRDTTSMMTSARSAKAPSEGPAASGGVTVTHQQKRAEADAAESARSVGNLLQRMEGAPAGQRDHLKRETETLHFLRESKKAQAELKKIVAGASSEEIERAQQPQHLVAKRQASLPVRRGTYFREQQQQQKPGCSNNNNSQQRQDQQRGHRSFKSLFDDSYDQENEHHQQQRLDKVLDMTGGLCFEDLAEPAQERKVGQSSVEAIASSSLPPISARMRGTIAAESIRSAASTERDEMVMMESARNRISNGAAAAAASSSSSGGEQKKILVRLPKVGLQLFSSVRK